MGGIEVLVLGRNKHESIIIITAGKRVAVKIVDVRGDRVDLGITAPRAVTVHREEIQEVIDREEKQNATKSNNPS